MSVAEADKSSTAVRIPAAPIERSVREAIGSLLGDERGLIDLEPQELTAAKTKAMLETARRLGTIIFGSVSDARAVLIDIGFEGRITADGVEGWVDLDSLMAKLGIAEHSVNHCRVPLRIGAVPTEQKRGIRMVVAPAGSNGPVTRDGRLIELLLRAREAYQQVALGQHRLETRKSNQPKYLVRLARLSFLAPDIVEAILEGRQPASLNARRLSRIADLPASWTDQRRLLGFA